MIVFNEDGCIKCGACEGTCPTSAIDVTPNAIIDYPKHFVNLRLRWYCRNRSLMTKYYQWKDRIIWKLGLSKTK